jgi:DNA-binding MarR family transcriptional regulator
MNLMNELIKLLIKMIKNYNRFEMLLENKKRSFGGIPLFASEIHTLVYIDAHKDENFTELSKGLGITKGAFTSITAKLEKKELIKKYYKEDNRKNVYFEVTRQGKKSCEDHEVFHNTFQIIPPDDVIAYLEENKEVLAKGLTYADQIITQLIEEVEKSA